MTNVLHTLKAKSDQLNYADIGESELIITIDRVVVSSPESTDQFIHVYYIGCNNRPWKTSKGMRRLLVNGWGDNSDDWIGKHVKLFGDSTVTWGGAECGGIRIRGMSDIGVKSFSSLVTIGKGKKRKVTVKSFIVENNDVITEIDANWINAIKKDPGLIEQINDPLYRKRIEKLLSDC